METKKTNKFHLSAIILLVALIVGIIIMTVVMQESEDVWLKRYSNATNFDINQSVVSVEDKYERYEVDEDGNGVQLLESSSQIVKWDFGTSEPYVSIRAVYSDMIQYDDSEYIFIEENWKNDTVVTTRYKGGIVIYENEEKISLKEYFYDSGRFDYFKKIDFTAKDNFSKLKITGYPRHLNATIKNEKLDETIVNEDIPTSSLMKNYSIDIQLDSKYNIKFQKFEYNDPSDKTVKYVGTTEIEQSSTIYSESLSTASIAWIIINVAISISIIAVLVVPVFKKKH